MILLSELHKRYLFLFHCVSRFFFVYSKTHIFWFDMTNKRIYVWVHPTDETVANSSSLHFPYFDMMHFFRRGYIRKQEMLLNYHWFNKSMFSGIWNLEIWLQVSLSYAKCIFYYPIDSNQNMILDVITLTIYVAK